MAQDSPARAPREQAGSEHQTIDRLGTGEPESNPELSEVLCRLLYGQDGRAADLDARLRELAEKHGDPVYSELIHLLSHLRFPPDEAKGYWLRVLAHRQALEEHLGESVDLRVAFVSYFVQVNRKLHNPKIIELKLFERTRESAYRDELTGLRNYRFFAEALRLEVARSEQYDTPLSLIMADVDDFKRFNDHHGHEAGNDVLAKIARLLTETLRDVDVCARYGGEEFAMILPMTPKTGARLVAERARRRILEQVFSSDRTPVTVSLGIATCPGDAAEARELVRCADRAMYLAKAGGKNQVQLYGGSSRSYRRVETSIQGSFASFGGGDEPLWTLNVSEGGLIFLSRRSLAVGSLIDLTLGIPGAARPINAAARVVSSERREGGEQAVAARLIDIPAADRFRWIRYVRDLAGRRGPARGSRSA